MYLAKFIYSCHNFLWPPYTCVFVSIVTILLFKVQFVIGTPPGGGRRRSAANSLCETPPSIWQVSPVAGND